MGSSERRRRSRAQMQERILHAALELFEAHGIEKTTIRAIADKIEYTPGIIYAYYKNKDEILYAIHQRGFALLTERQRQALAVTNPMERLIELGDAYIRFALEYPAYYDLMFINEDLQALIRKQGGWTEGTEAFALVKDTVIDCIDQHYIPAVDADSVAYAMWAFAHGLVSLYLRDRTVMIPADRRIAVLKSAFNYMLRGETIPE